MSCPGRSRVASACVYACRYMQMCVYICVHVSCVNIHFGHGSSCLHSSCAPCPTMSLRFLDCASCLMRSCCRLARNVIDCWASHTRTPLGCLVQDISWNGTMGILVSPRCACVRACAPIPYLRRRTVSAAYHEGWSKVECVCMCVILCMYVCMYVCDFVYVCMHVCV